MTLPTYARPLPTVTSAGIVKYSYLCRLLRTRKVEAAVLGPEQKTELVQQVCMRQGWAIGTSDHAKILVALLEAENGLNIDELTVKCFSKKKVTPTQLSDLKKQHRPSQLIERLQVALTRLYARPDCPPYTHSLALSSSGGKKGRWSLDFRDRWEGTTKLFWAPHLAGDALNALTYGCPLFFRDPNGTRFFRYKDINTEGDPKLVALKEKGVGDHLYVSRGELHMLVEIVRLLDRGDNLAFGGLKKVSHISEIEALERDLFLRHPKRKSAEPVNLVLLGSVRNSDPVERYSKSDSWGRRLVLQPGLDGVSVSGTSNASWLKMDHQEAQDPFWPDVYKTGEILSRVLVTRRPGFIDANSTCTIVASNGSTALLKMSTGLTQDEELHRLLSRRCPQLRVDAEGRQTVIESSLSPMDMMRQGLQFFQLLFSVSVPDAHTAQRPELLCAVWYDPV